MKRRIICIGNRLFPEDDTGARVYVNLCRLVCISDQSHKPEAGARDGARFTLGGASGRCRHTATVSRSGEECGLAVSPDVEVVDGGLGGLDLLRFVEGAERVVFVDRVEGFGQPGEVVVLDASNAARAVAPRYNHAAGLAYLLKALPYVCDGAIPRVFVVGVEGCANEETIALAARISLKMAAENHDPHVPTGPAAPGGSICVPTQP